MIINIGDKCVISVEMTKDGPMCQVKFPISEEDFEYFSKHLCLDNLNFVLEIERNNGGNRNLLNKSIRSSKMKSE